MAAAISLFFVGLSTISFAETFEKKGGVVYTIITGQIQSVDTAKSLVVIKDASTGLEKIVAVFPALTASLNVGESVKVTLGQGSNLAMKVIK